MIRGPVYLLKMSASSVEKRCFTGKNKKIDNFVQSLENVFIAGPYPNALWIY